MRYYDFVVIMPWMFKIQRNLFMNDEMWQATVDHAEQKRFFIYADGI